MTESGAQDWIDDLTDASDDEDDSPSLFEENFRQMVNNGDIEDMTVATLREQVDRIDDAQILVDAVDADTRSTAEEVYRKRIGDINEENEDDGTEEAEDGDVSDDSVEVGDTEESAEETEPSEGSGDGEDPEADDGDGDGDGSDVLNDLVDGDDSEDDAEEADEDLLPPPESDSGEVESEEDPEDVSDNGVSQDADTEEEQDSDGDSDLPDVDVSSLAPDAVSREDAADRDKQSTMLVWGPEGSGKSHIAHTAPEPICYIDTEGKADELAEKFDGKRIHYFVADNYDEAKAAMEQSLDLLHEYLDAGTRGTIVVDSMTAMWEYAKVSWSKFAYQTDDLSEVNFQSELEGENDWTKIKGRHNDSFREKILDSPFHVVLTAGQKEDYNAVFDGGGKQWIPDGEKWNKYAVKDVVRLRRDGSGRTVGDLKKAALTRYSFVGLEWPDFDSIYESIEDIYEAETSPGDVDVTHWPYDVIDGQPLGNEPGDADDSDDGGNDGD